MTIEDFTEGEQVAMLFMRLYANPYHVDIDNNCRWCHQAQTDPWLPRLADHQEDCPWRKGQIWFERLRSEETSNEANSRKSENGEG